MRQKLFIVFLALGIVVLVGFIVFVIKTGRISPFAAGTGAMLSLSPSSGNKVINTNFTVDIILNTNTQDTAGTDIILNYNPADLEVQDANTTTVGVQITPGTLYASYPANTANSTTGKIYFSGIITPGATTGYNGTGTLATITFKVLRVAPTSAVTFSFTVGATNDSNVVAKATYTDILETITNASFALVPADVSTTLSLRLQGRTSHDSTATNLKVYNTGTTTKVYEKADIVTDAAGNASFIITGITAGNYDFKIKVNYFLTKSLTNIPLTNPLTMNFTDLKGGDLNNDNIVNSVDFSSLTAKWNLTDIAADINEDGVVNTIDFAILNSNWFVSGT